MKHAYALIKLLGLSLITLPLYTVANEWTPEQREVLAAQKHCVAITDADQKNDCFHKDFVGFGMNLGPMTTTKKDRRKLRADNSSVQFEHVLFKPLSVYVNGNFAVVNYVAWTKQTNKKTGEETMEIGRWMDVLLKDNGKWSWIADHGVTGP